MKLLMKRSESAFYQDLKLKSTFVKYFSGPTRGWLCVLGGFILCLSFSADFSYPNINSYLTSYMRNNQTNGYNNDLTYDDFVFLSTTKIITQGVSMPFAGDLCRRLGPKLSILIGSAIYSVGFMLTCISIRYQYVWAIITLSMHGLGFSFVYATAIGAAQKWFPKNRKGFVGSIVLSGYGFGSLIWIPLQTAYVNPANINAEKDPECADNPTDADCNNLYYRDLDLLSRIPWMFLILGITYAVMGLVAVLLISEPENSTPEVISLKSEDGKDTVQEEAVSLKPLEVLKTSTFYQIWMGFCAVGLCNGLMSTYSKTFGLTFINDDHYFANVAIVQNVFNGACRIFWGFGYDRLGFKTCFLVIGSVVSIATALLPTLPFLGEESIGARAGYGILMVLLYGTFPGIYAIVAAGVNEAFGPLHYKANFGLLFTQSVAYCIIMLIMTKISVIQAALGYTGMFLIAGGVGIFGILAVCLLPKHLSDRNCKPTNC